MTLLVILQARLEQDLQTCVGLQCFYLAFDLRGHAQNIKSFVMKEMDNYLIAWVNQYGL